MDTVGHMRKWLDELDFDEYDSISCDTREDCYLHAWSFWCQNASASDIDSYYRRILGDIDESELEGEDDEDSDD